MPSTASPQDAFPFGSWAALRTSFVTAAERSPFVRRQLQRSASAADATRSPDGWAGLRPVTKADLIADQQLAAPYGTRRCVPASEVGLVVESSGSTGQGCEVHYLSRADTARTAVAWSRYVAGMGVTADDTVLLCFPIGMAGGGVRHLLAYSELGAIVLRAGGLSSEARIEAIRRYHATTLVATPAYVDRLGAIAEAEGIRPGDLGIRRIVVATQAVSVDWVRATEESWGARLHEWYGTSAGVAAFSCGHGMVGAGADRGTLHWDPEIAAQEIVDRASGRHVSDGERGEVVATPLINEAEPLFRIATGDEARFRAPGSCACGSPWPGIESGTVRRLDDMVKVKGINVWPAAIEARVLDCADVLDYRARVWQDDMRRERLTVEILASPGVDACRATEIATRLYEDTGLSFEVAFVDDRASWSQLTTGEAGKAKRWIDERGDALPC